MAIQELRRPVSVIASETVVNPVSLHARVPVSDNGNRTEHTKMIDDITEGRPLSPEAAMYLMSVPSNEFRALVGQRYYESIEPVGTIDIITHGRPLTPDAIVHLRELPQDEFQALVRARYSEPRRHVKIPTLGQDTKIK